MSSHHKSVVAALAVTAMFGGTAQSAEVDDKAAIAEVMTAYSRALNASSIDDCLALYADDGVFMAPYSQSAVGRAEVRQAYEHVFRTITLHVQFTVAEIVEMSPRWAFVRTNSVGTNRVNATGATSAEGNQELFIFGKGDDGKWRIERYSFSPTNQPQA